MVRASPRHPHPRACVVELPPSLLREEEPAQARRRAPSSSPGHGRPTTTPTFHRVAAAASATNDDPPERWPNDGPMMWTSTTSDYDSSAPSCRRRRRRGPRRDEARLIGVTCYSEPIRRRGRTRCRASEEFDSAVESYNLGVVLMEGEEGDLESAVARFEEALTGLAPLRRGVENDDDAAVAVADLTVCCYANAGYCHYLLERYADAALCFERSIDLCRRTVDRLRSSRQSAADGGVVSFAAAKCFMLRTVESTTSLARSYDMAGGTRSRDVVPALIGDARAMLDAIAEIFDDDDATTIRTTASDDDDELDREEDLEDDLRYADAAAKQRRGECDRAIRAYKRFLCSYTRRQEERRRRTTRPSLASAVRPPSSRSRDDGGRNAASSSHLSRAVRTSAAMHGIAQCLLSLSRPEEARRVAQAAFTVRRKAFKDLWGSHPDAADSAYLMGHLRRDREEYVDALALYRECIRIRCRAFGLDHGETLKAMCYVAVVNRERNELTEALYVCRSVLARGRDAVPRRFYREMTVLREELLREMMEEEGASADDGRGPAARKGERDRRVLYMWSGKEMRHAATA